VCNGAKRRHLLSPDQVEERDRQNFWLQALLFLRGTRRTDNRGGTPLFGRELDDRQLRSLRSVQRLRGNLCSRRRVRKGLAGTRQAVRGRTEIGLSGAASEKIAPIPRISPQ